MPNRLISLCCAYVVGLAFVNAQVKSPDDFLPYKLGERFTPHHLLVEYFEHVAEESPKVQLIEYGLTNELRPLILAVVSSAENIASIEEIRLNNLRLTGLEPGEASVDDGKAIVWLSYSVHGNEAAGSEASMQVVYDLIQGNSEADEWLENTVVIIDPSVNPDGYSRYTNWNNQVSDKHYNSKPEALEHQEPWPGGRVNHYLFDLNRDWAWQTQVESQLRMEVYNKWMPHVHADLHEMYPENPYYFAPAAQPYHEYITDWQASFQDTIGRNHARYFDAEGWGYFTKEIFDLFYPSYGDTYPTFNGAIGMTYEKGGHGRAGRAYNLQHGDTLRLIDRITQHTTASLSTVEVSSVHAEEVLTQFREYFDAAINNPEGNFRSYLIKGDNPGGKLHALTQLLDRMGIAYSHPEGSGSAQGVKYGEEESTSFSYDEGDLLISAYQPRGVLAQVMFDPDNELVDSMTYDLTAWALPYAYGLEGYATEQRIGSGETFICQEDKSVPLNDAYAYAIRWESLESARMLGRAMQLGLNVRVAHKPFAIAGETFDRGTVLVLGRDNRKVEDFDSHISALHKAGAEIISLESGYVDKGKDLGSDYYSLMEKPTVLTLVGEQVSAYNAGQIWYTFEQVLDYPLTRIDVQELGSVDLDDYSVLVLPEGWYSMGDKTLEKVTSWVRGGGRLIALGSALGKVEGKPGFSLKRYAEDSRQSELEKQSKKEELDMRLEPYSSSRRRNISDAIPGTVFVAKVDTTHALSYGLGHQYFTLKTSTRTYEHLTKAVNAIYLNDDPVYFGFAGANALKKVNSTVVFASERMGRGTVTYFVDNPLYRGFWYNGIFAFSNAVFFVGN